MLWGSQRGSRDWSTCRITDWENWVCLLQRREDKGRFNCYPPLPKGGEKNFWLFTEGHNEEKRWQSQVARKFQSDIRKNSPWRWFNARTDCPENLGISILSKFQLGISLCYLLWYWSWTHFEHMLDKKILKNSFNIYSDYFLGMHLSIILKMKMSKGKYSSKVCFSFIPWI